MDNQENYDFGYSDQLSNMDYQEDDEQFVGEFDNNGEENHERNLAFNEEKHYTEADDEDFEADDESIETDDEGSIQGQSDIDEEGQIDIDREEYDPSRDVRYRDLSAADREIVDRLVAAAKNLDNVYDISTSQAVRKIKRGGFKDVQFYNLGLAALDKVKRSQRERQVPKYHGKSYRKYSSRSDRIDSLALLLEKRKTAVKMLLDADYLSRCTDDPEKELDAKNNNERLNNKRKEAMDSMKKEKKGSQGISDSDDGNSKKLSKRQQAGDPFTTPSKKALPKKVTTGSNKRKTPDTHNKSAKRKKTPHTGQREAEAEIDEQEDIDQSPTKKQRRSLQRYPNRPRQQANIARPMASSAAPMTPGTFLQNQQQLMMPPAAQASGPVPYAAPVAHGGFLGFPRDYSSALALERLSESNDITPQEFAQLDMEYRIIICDLLNVSREWANTLSLLSLRQYARSYYQPLKSDIWYYPDMPIDYQFARARHLQDHMGERRQLLVVAHELSELAHDHGSALDVDGHLIVHWRPALELHSPVQPVEQRALGFEVDNVFEMPWFRRNATDPRVPHNGQ